MTLQVPDPNPFEGTTKVPPGAGVRGPDVEQPSEHRPGGMLNGDLVRVRFSDHHQKYTLTGRVIQLVSVPSPHLLVEEEQDNGEVRRGIIFCHAISHIERV